MKGDSINSLLQMQSYRRAEMEGQIAKRDVYGETKTFVENWRKSNGLEGTKALPPRNEVPFQWMLPFLDKVETQDTKPSPMANQGMMIAGTPNFPGGGFTTTSGAFVDLSGEAYYLDGGELIPQGGYDPAKHGDVIPHGGPNLPRVMNNQDMMIAQGPELGGTGRLLTIGEYNQAVDTGFNNLMNSDMTPQDFEDYVRIKETAKRQMLDGV